MNIKSSENLGMISSYKPFVGNKQIYLKRKKFIVTKIKELKKVRKGKKRLRKMILSNQINLWADTLDLLIIMYKYRKFTNKQKTKYKYC